MSIVSDVYDAISFEATPTRQGSLKINRKRGKKEDVQISLDAARIFGILVPALLELNQDKTLDFLSALHVDGEFPQQELLKGIQKKLDEPENKLTVEYGGQGLFKADKLYRIRLSELEYQNM